MDDFDRNIATLLARDGKLTMQDLAEQVGLSPSACTRRVQALERNGVIRGYRAMLDPAALGLAVDIFVEFALERQDAETLTGFEAALMDCPNVLSCHLMSGQSDYLVHMVAQDISDFERLHSGFLSHLPGVSRIESKFSLREVTNRAVLPIARPR